MQSVAQRSKQPKRTFASRVFGVVVDRLAAHIARAHPGLRGFTRPNLFRMRQFYEAYAGTNTSR
jgi:hypothetical protein